MWMLVLLAPRKGPFFLLPSPLGILARETVRQGPWGDIQDSLGLQGVQSKEPNSEVFSVYT